MPSRPVSNWVGETLRRKTDATNSPMARIPRITEAMRSVERPASADVVEPSDRPFGAKPGVVTPFAGAVGWGAGAVGWSTGAWVGAGAGAWIAACGAAGAA